MYSVWSSIGQALKYFFHVMVVAVTLKASFLVFSMIMANRQLLIVALKLYMACTLKVYTTDAHQTPSKVMRLIQGRRPLPSINSLQMEDEHQKLQRIRYASTIQY